MISGSTQLGAGRAAGQLDPGQPARRSGPGAGRSPRRPAVTATSTAGVERPPHADPERAVRSRRTAAGPRRRVPRLRPVRPPSVGVPIRYSSSPRSARPAGRDGPARPPARRSRGAGRPGGRTDLARGLLGGRLGRRAQARPGRPPAARPAPLRAAAGSPPERQRSPSRGGSESVTTTAASRAERRGRRGPRRSGPARSSAPAVRPGRGTGLRCGHAIPSPGPLRQYVPGVVPPFAVSVGGRWSWTFRGRPSSASSGQAGSVRRGRSPQPDLGQGPSAGTVCSSYVETPLAGTRVRVPASGLFPPVRKVCGGQLFQCSATRSAACCSHWA